MIHAHKISVFTTTLRGRTLLLAVLIVCTFMLVAWQVTVTYGHWS